MSRQIGDIENDLGQVEWEIEELESQLAIKRGEKALFLDELEAVDSWGDEGGNNG